MYDYTPAPVPNPSPNPEPSPDPTRTLALTLALTPPRCDCKRDAVRGVRLSHLPPILSFHLARFRYRRLETPPRHLGCIRLCGERDGEHRPVKLP